MEKQNTGWARRIVFTSIIFTIGVILFAIAISLALPLKIGGTAAASSSSSSASSSANPTAEVVGGIAVGLAVGFSLALAAIVSLFAAGGSLALGILGTIYSFRRRLSVPSRGQKTYLLIAGILFSLLCAAAVSIPIIIFLVPNPA